MTIDTSSIVALRDRVEKFRKEIPVIAGGVLIEQIKRTTARGIGADGKPFTPYTRRYGEYKKKRTGADTPVNFRLTGRAISSLKQETDGGETFVAFAEEHDKKVEGFENKKGLILGVHPDTPGIVENLLVRRWDAIT